MNIEMIKKLRRDTGLGIYETKKALEENEYDYDKAISYLKKRMTNSYANGKCGHIETYNHNGRIGVVVQVNCETDFVTRTPEFLSLCHEIAMQIAAINPENVEQLNESAYV